MDETNASTAKLNQLINTYFALPTTEMAPFLARLQREDAGAATALRALLQQAARFTLEPLAVEAGDPSVLDLQGRRLGAFRLTDILGRGGMGTVYLAERDDGTFEQQVAVKVLTTRIVSPATLTRFQRERQILAGLKHPAVPQILDGGVTDDHRPYFVMAYIAGENIDHYCRRHRLDIRARLELLLQVSEALTFAHRNMIVHRDIKPSNVFVDQTGHVKLLDFGIAAVLDDQVGQPTRLTRTGELFFTPEYAAPEQVRGERVTAACDLYAFGVLMYQLLTERLPLPADADHLPALLHAVSHFEPPAPSRARRTGDLARVREMQEVDDILGDHTVRGLRGDLDLIVLKVLRKDSSARYSSMEALSADLRAFLNGLPVFARPRSRAYSLRLFVKRHRIPVAMTALVFFSLLVGAVVATRLFVQARLENAKFRATQAFLETMLVSAGPDHAPGQDTAYFRAILDQAAADYQRQFSDQREVRADIARVLGETYNNLGLYREALPHFEEARAARPTRVGADEQTLNTAVSEALALLMLGKYDECGAVLGAVIPAARSLEAEDRARVLSRALLLRGSLYDAQARFDEALADLEEGLRIGRAGLPPCHLNLGSIERKLSKVFRAHGRFEDAERVLRRLLATIPDCQGVDHSSYANTQFMLAISVWAAGRSAEAALLLDEVVARRRHIYGADAPLTRNSRRIRAAVWLDLGRLTEAENEIRAVLAGFNPAGDADHPDWVAAQRTLADILYEQARYEEAFVLYRDSLAGERRVWGETHPDTLDAVYRLADRFAAQGRTESAVRLLEDNLLRYMSRLGGEDVTTLSVQKYLAGFRVRVANAD